MSKSINIDHSSGSMITSDGFISLNENGAVKIGSGKTIGDGYNNISISDYEGCIRFNETTKKLEYCDGIKWIEISSNDFETKTSSVYSMLF
jgi:hypothetical protein